MPRFLLGCALLLASDSLPQLPEFLTISNDLLANRGLLFSKIQNSYTKTIPQASQHFLHLLHTNCTLTTWQDYFGLVKIREAILQLGAQVADKESNLPVSACKPGLFKGLALAFGRQVDRLGQDRFLFAFLLQNSAAAHVV